MNNETERGLGAVLAIVIGGGWLFFYLLNGFFDIFRFIEECF